MQLEVEIASKAFTNAAGERHDVLAEVNFALGSGEVGVFKRDGDPMFVRIGVMR